MNPLMCSCKSVMFLLQMDSHCDTDCPKAPIACTFSTFGCKERVGDATSNILQIGKSLGVPYSTTFCQTVVLYRCSDTTWLSICRSSRKCTCVTWQSLCDALALMAPHHKVTFVLLDLLFHLMIKEQQQHQPRIVREIQAVATAVAHPNPAKKCKGSGIWTDD